MVLEGKKIYVKTLGESDAEALFSLEQRNREFFQLYRGARDDSFYTVEAQIDRIRKFLENQKNDSAYLFGILVIETNELVGQVMLTEVVRENLQSCWIGYFLDKAHNGKGYTSEAVQLVVSYAFNELKLHRIEAGVMLHNIASMKVLEKAGFHKEGIARKNVKINGKWEDHLTLAVINEDD